MEEAGWKALWVPIDTLRRYPVRPWLLRLWSFPQARPMRPSRRESAAIQTVNRQLPESERGCSAAPSIK